MVGNRVGLASFPRSGNSFLRKFLERITGITTGGEISIDLPLQMVGLLGEGHGADDMVWLTKSHHPLRQKSTKSDPFIKSVEVDKQLFLMRSPVDNFYAFAVFHNLCSHSLAIKNNLKEEFPEWWDAEVLKLSNFWYNYYENTVRISAQAIPTLAVRYEDLILDPK